MQSFGKTDARDPASRAEAAVQHDVRADARAGIVMMAIVRTGRGEALCSVHDLSPRGIRIAMASPPQRGEYVEIITKSHSLIGQVRWASDLEAGIVLREPVDVDVVLRGQGSPARVRPAAIPTAVPRPAAARPVASAICQHSQFIARKIQFIAVIAFGACAALLIALGVHDLLAGVVNQVNSGLPG